eukprot:COSAG06_NODE_24905_length_649_cov_1.680000_2_plen_108_part_01
MCDPAPPLHRPPLLRPDAAAPHRADDPEVRWLDSRGCDPLWQKAAELGVVFHVYIDIRVVPEQLEQVAAMAARHPGVKVILDHFAELDITAPPSEGIDKIVALLAPLP